MYKLDLFGIVISYRVIVKVYAILSSSICGLEYLVIIYKFYFQIYNITVHNVTILDF